MPLLLVVLLFVAVVVIWIVLRSGGGKGSTAIPAASSGAAWARPLGQTSQNVEQALGLLATCAQPRGVANLRTAVQLRISDHVPSDWHYELGGGSCTLVTGPATDPSVTITATSQIWIELAQKKLSFSGAA